MKVTKEVISRFESDQSQWGTKVAIQNVLWCLASNLMTDIGVTSLNTKYVKAKNA